MKKYIYLTLCLITMFIFSIIGYKEILNSNEYGKKIADSLVMENGV